MIERATCQSGIVRSRRRPWGRLSAIRLPSCSLNQRNPAAGMKLLFDFLPIVLFFVAYKLADIYIATGVLIAATLAQVGWIWLRQRRVEKIPLFTAALVLVLGGATLLLHDPVFVKWKPTVVNWLFAVVFLGSRFIGQKTLLERMKTLGCFVRRHVPVAWMCQQLV